MEVKYLSLLGICFILVIILGISGCTSSNNANPQTDIVVDGILMGSGIMQKKPVGWSLEI